MEKRSSTYILKTRSLLMSHGVLELPNETVSEANDHITLNVSTSM